jgi:hypothetical protein
MNSLFLKLERLVVLRLRPEFLPFLPLKPPIVELSGIFENLPDFA